MDLSTTYLGLELEHPFVVGAGPLADHPEGIEALADAGVSAIVMRSLFEEQLSAAALASVRSSAQQAEAFWEASGFLAAEDDGFLIGPEGYLEKLREIRGRTGVPVIASLNGHGGGGWVRFASRLEEAGADALELCLYHVPTKPDVTGAELEQEAVDTLAGVRSAVSIPVAVKLSPFYTSIPNLVKRLGEAGADGYVLFNRYYEPDIDVDELEIRSHLTPSTSAELNLRLRWLAIVQSQTAGDLAVSGGVHTTLDAVKAIMCGAKVVQLVSSLMGKGPDHVRTLRQGLVAWLQGHEYESLGQMHGSMDLDHCPDPTALARANYLYRLQSWR